MIFLILAIAIIARESCAFTPISHTTTITKKAVRGSSNNNVFFVGNVDHHVKTSSTSSCLIQQQHHYADSWHMYRDVAMEMSSDTATADGEGGGVSSGGTATISEEIFNLVKSIVGAGVLSLPAGIAAFGNAPSAAIPAAILITLIGTLSGYGFSLIGRVCSYTGATSYREAWSKTVGPKSSWIPAVSCTFKSSVAVLAYSMILSDTVRDMARSVGMTKVTKTSGLLGVTGLVLLPLCLLKNLSSLAPFSLLGIAGMGYTAWAMAFRLLTGAYSVPGGKFLGDLAEGMSPSFGSVGAMGVFHPSAFILICMLSTAYMAHFNAPKFYNELKNNTLDRYNKVVSTSFALSISIFVTVAMLGFLTFGGASSSLILNNYSTNDTLMGLCRLAVTVSIIFSYPLAFVGFRDGLIDLAKIPPSKRTDGFLNKFTIAILSFITFASLNVPDLSFVLAFGGATLGNALIYIYPALMFRKAVKMKDEVGKASVWLKREVKFALASALLGIGMGAVGARMAIKNAFF